MEKKKLVIINAVIILLLTISMATPQSVVADYPSCGKQGDGGECPLDQKKYGCCSKLGYCGGTEEYCSYDRGCQSGDCRHYGR
ncbi:hypothetical protein LINGRAHAP2_LOCUS22512 [Linum grandiflorum]